MQPGGSWSMKLLAKSHIPSQLSRALRGDRARRQQGHHRGTPSPEPELRHSGGRVHSPHHLLPPKAGALLAKIFSARTSCGGRPRPRKGPAARRAPSPSAGSAVNRRLRPGLVHVVKEPLQTAVLVRLGLAEKQLLESGAESGPTLDALPHRHQGRGRGVLTPEELPPRSRGVASGRVEPEIGGDLTPPRRRPCTPRKRRAPPQPRSQKPRTTPNILKARLLPTSPPRDRPPPRGHLREAVSWCPWRQEAGAAPCAIVRPLRFPARTLPLP